MVSNLYNENLNNSHGKPESKNKASMLLAVLIIAGIALTWIGCYFIYKGYESRSWPQYQGKITASYVEKQRKRSSDTGSTSYDIYVARVKYSYRANGRSYTNDEIGFGGNEYTSKKKFKTEQYLNQFPVGKSVTVYYNPKKNKQSVLRQGVTGGSLLILVGGIIFLLAGAGMFYSFIIKRENNLIKPCKRS
jgi:flagellar basal body-associated protein FliL